MMQGQGVVYLVGAGPGDPGLLTRRGAEVLAKCEVVIYDHLASARLLELCPPNTLQICAGKSSGHCTLNQDQINEMLVFHACAGMRVVRLKGGDPLVFGRGAEEAEHLAKHGVAYEIVPGVTAGVGATAYAGIPITHRAAASAVAFVTGHGDPEAAPTLSEGRSRLDWSALAHFPGTLVIYMGVTHLAAICRTLIKAGKPAETPAAVIESGSLPSQRVLEGSLGTIAIEAHRSLIHPPALLVVGQVVHRRSELAWFESLPLFGQRIVITRPIEEVPRSAAVLEAMGAEVLVAPTVLILPLQDPTPVNDAIDRLQDYDWLVFTSANGVRFFFEQLLAGGTDIRAVGSLRLATIGPGTAEALFRYHLRADLVPESYRSEALAEALKSQAAGRRILLARADRGRSLLLDELRKVADVDQVSVYRNVDAESLPEAVVERISAGTVDWVTVTSSAIAGSLYSLLPEAARSRVGRETRLASLSPVTSATLERLGWNATVEASIYNWNGLIRVLSDRVQSEHPLKNRVR
jgi:uroporphyrinogen III methyltransferase/synthase